MHDTENGRKLWDWKMAENARLENGGMENDSPGKRRKNVGLQNGGKCTTRK